MFNAATSLLPFPYLGFISLVLYSVFSLVLQFDFVAHRLRSFNSIAVWLENWN